MEISRGKIGGAQKVVLYGPEGIGKSTFAAQLPQPLFIDTEGGTRHLDVQRFVERPSSWTLLLEQVRYVQSHPDLCRTLVIDTADWAEALCVKHICDKAQLGGLEDFGYGKGYVYLQEEFARLLQLLTDLAEGRGVNVLLTAHAAMRKFEQPQEMGAYDRWELKLSKKVAPLVKEWADLLLFANYEVIVLTDTNKHKKATGGERVMYATHHPCWDAKNRHGLPDKLPFAYAAVAQIFAGAQAVQTPAKTAAEQQPAAAQETVKTEAAPPAKAAYGETPISELPVTEGNPASLVEASRALAALMFEYNVTEAELQRVVADRGYFPADTPVLNYGEDFINGKLVACWPQVFRLIEKRRA